MERQPPERSYPYRSRNYYSSRDCSDLIQSTIDKYKRVKDQCGDHGLESRIDDIIGYFKDVGKSLDEEQPR